MGIARYLSKLASGLSSEGVVPAAKGGTGSTSGGGGGGPKISGATVTDSSYNVLDDTAVALAGGYIKITGSGFETGCQVLINTTAATSVTFISATEVRAQVPATTAGTYILYVVNTDGGTAIRVNGITFSATPTWTTESSLTGVVNSAISIQLTATGATTFSVAGGSSLPSGVSLSSSGLLTGTVTGISGSTTYNFTVIATDAEFQDSPKTFAFNISVGDPYFMYTTLLLSANGTNAAQNNTFVDSSTNNLTITRTGNVAQGTFSPYGPNWSNYFDGAGDYLDTVSASSQFAFGTGDFTVEFWIKTTASTFNIINPTSATGSGYWGLLFSAGNFYWNDSYNVTYNILVNATSILNDAWHHVAICRTSGSSKVYFDGVSQITQADSTNYSGVSTWRIGSGNVGAYLGYLSNLRVVKGTAVYASNFTPSTTPLTAISGTSLLTCQSNRFIDNSANNFTITATGTPTIQRFSPFSPTAAYSTSTIGGSGYLSGASSTWLAVPINATFAFGTNNYTYEAWVYPTSFPNAYNTVFCNFLDNEGSKGWSLLITSTGLIHVNNQGTYNNSTNALSLNTWTHIAVCRVGNIVTRYINGVADPTTLTVTASITNVAAQGPTIGGSPEYSNSREWNGYISDARVVSGTALYTSNFTLSTTPLTAVSGTSLLLNYTNAGIIDNTMINNLETVGNAQISTAQTKFGSGSMSFDGTGDYLSSLNNLSLGFGSGSFTVEGWIYLNNTSGTKGIMFGKGSNSFGLRIGQGYLGNVNGLNITKSNVADLEYCAFTFVTSTWYHIAVVRSGTTIYFFVNGTQQTTQGSGGGSFSFVNPTNGYYIGCNNDTNEQFAGYIDDLRITKGLARYTANFTLPTVPAIPQ